MRLPGRSTNSAVRGAMDKTSKKDLPIEILSSVRVDVFLYGKPSEPWRVPLISYLDRAGIRVIGDIPDLKPDTRRLRRIAGSCAGCISVAPDPPPIQHLQLSNLGPDLPEQVYTMLDEFIERLLENPPTPAYAFMIGRLERDFAHAREAFCAAVENEAGMTCLWSGDGRHRMTTDSVRGTTNTLIEHATFVIADLSLGIENPNHENPSRAHEIGLASAFRRPLMLCSREPRRYPYFSIGDLQMFFWTDEEELYDRTKEWIREHRAEFSRTVWNDRLPKWGATEEPRIRASSFMFDPSRSYRWPENRPYSSTELLAMSASIGGIALFIALAGGVQDAIGPAIYPAAGFITAGAWFTLQKWNLGHVARLLPLLLILTALVTATVILIADVA